LKRTGCGTLKTLKTRSLGWRGRTRTQLCGDIRDDIIQLLLTSAAGNVPGAYPCGKFCTAAWNFPLVDNTNRAYGVFK
jgi:hypothetical protein